MYGAFIIHPKKRTIQYDRDQVVVISDWSDENPDQIIKNLRKDGDYYLYKKETVRSWLGAIKSKSFGILLANEWTRMHGMDLSDVGYDAFLINGQREGQLPPAKAGEKIRLRIINAAASTYFHVALGKAPMKVISADGVDIEPTMAQELLMGMAETYDALFEVPAGKSHELRATAQDGTGFATVWVGEQGASEKVHAPDKAAPELYGAMDHGGGDKGHEGHGQHHPMHLHGHFFRVLNASKEFSPLKHTVDVPPHVTRVIEFLANEPGEWLLHCHNLYHMKSGMARIVKYVSFTPSLMYAPTWAWAAGLLVTEGSQGLGLRYRF